MPYETPGEWEPYPPIFTIIDYPQVIKNAPGTTVSINIVVKNVGGQTGEVEVRIVFQGVILDSKTVSLDPAQLTSVTLTFTLPGQAGTYTYRIEAFNKTFNAVDDYKDITAYVGDPKFKIYYTPSSIEGYPTQPVSIAVSVENIGYSGGYATVRLFDHNNNKIYEETKYIEVDSRVGFYANVQLPGEFETYTWRVEVLNNKTQSIDDQATITIYVTQPPPHPYFRIIEAPTSVEGWAGEQKTITVKVKNFGQLSGKVEVRILDHNNRLVVARRISLSPGVEGSVNLSIILPSYGEYAWIIQAYNVSIIRLDDSKALVVKANDIHFQIVDYTRTVSGYSNESKSVSVTVKNTGNTEGVAKIIIKDHNGVERYSNQATISPNNTYTFYASITLPSTVGTYEWKVELWNQSLNRKEQEETIYVVVQTEPEPEFLIIEYIPEYIYGYTGQQVYVDVTIKNAGSAYGESIVRLLDHNRSVVVEKDRRTIAPGGWYTDRLVFNLPSNSGEYTWYIQSYNATKSRIDHEVSLRLTVVAVKKSTSITLTITPL